MASVLGIVRSSPRKRLVSHSRASADTGFAPRAFRFRMHTRAPEKGALGHAGGRTPPVGAASRARAQPLLDLAGRGPRTVQALGSGAVGGHGTQPRPAAAGDYQPGSRRRGCGLRGGLQPVFARPGQLPRPAGHLDGPRLPGLSRSGSVLLGGVRAARVASGLLRRPGHPRRRPSQERLGSGRPPRRGQHPLCSGLLPPAPGRRGAPARGLRAPGTREPACHARPRFRRPRGVGERRAAQPRTAPESLEGRGRTRLGVLPRRGHPREWPRRPHAHRPALRRRLTHPHRPGACPGRRRRPGAAPPRYPPGRLPHERRSRGLLRPREDARARLYRKFLRGGPRGGSPAHNLYYPHSGSPPATTPFPPISSANLPSGGPAL
jgi:hypothetical protein